MNVEDITSKISVIYFRYTAWLKRPNFWVHVSPGSAETLEGEVGKKSPFNSVLTQQHLGKKLPKLVNVRSSYSVLHQCRFFETQCSTAHVKCTSSFWSPDPVDLNMANSKGNTMYCSTQSEAADETTLLPSCFDVGRCWLRLQFRCYLAPCKLSVHCPLLCRPVELHRYRMNMT